MLNLFLFLFLGTLGWGVSLCLIKILLVSLTPTEIVFYRVLIGSFSLFAILLLLRLKPHKLKDLFQDGLILGLFNMALPFYLTTLAEKTVSSALASVLNGLTPLCTFLLGFCFYSERPTFRIFNCLSLVLGFLGVVLINFDTLRGGGQVFHILAMLGTCFSYGIAANYLKTHSHGKDPLWVSAFAASISSLIMLSFQLKNGPLISWHYPRTGIQLAALIWLGLVGSGLSLYLYCLLIRRMGAVIASMTTYLMTVTGVFLGVVLLDERMSWIVILGCTFILLSLLMMNHTGSLERFFKRPVIAPSPALSEG